jgi:hypothetical protein
LSNYPQLEKWLEDEKEVPFKRDVHISLGPEGKYYANSGAGQIYLLPGSISEEIEARLTSNNSYQHDPLQVAIGVDNAYVMVGNKGDVCWDLKGRYGNLDKFLREAVSGVKVSDNLDLHSSSRYLRMECSRSKVLRFELKDHQIISLSPFNDEEYCVVFKNGDTHMERRPRAGGLSRGAGGRRGSNCCVM